MRQKLKWGKKLYVGHSDNFTTNTKQKIKLGVCMQATDGVCVYGAHFGKF